MEITNDKIVLSTNQKCNCGEGIIHKIITPTYRQIIKSRFSIEDDGLIKDIGPEGEILDPTSLVTIVPEISGLKASFICTTCGAMYANDFRKNILKAEYDNKRALWFFSLKSAKLSKDILRKDIAFANVVKVQQSKEHMGDLKNTTKVFYNPEQINYLFFLGKRKNGTLTAFIGQAEKEEFEEKHETKAVPAGEFFLFDEKLNYHQFYLPKSSVIY